MRGGNRILGIRIRILITRGKDRARGKQKVHGGAVADAHAEQSHAFAFYVIFELVQAFIHISLFPYLKLIFRAINLCLSKGGFSRKYH